MTMCRPHAVTPPQGSHCFIPPAESLKETQSLAHISGTAARRAPEIITALKLQGRVEPHFGGKANNGRKGNLISNIIRRYFFRLLWQATN